MKVLILDTIHPVLQDMLSDKGFECVNLANATDSEVNAHRPTAEGIVVRSRYSFGKAEFEKSPNLQFIGRVGAGLEHINGSVAKKLGIEVLSSPEGNRQAVAEHALGMLLSMFNNIPASDRQVRTGQWIRKANEGQELEGKTVAIIGYGNTGSAFAKVISGFRIQRLAFDKYKKGFGSESIQEVTMQQVYEMADVVSLHLPMTDETHHLVNADWINRFAKPFYLINTSRGNIVNTHELLDALDDGRLLGACLDVLEFETENLKMPPFDDLPDTAKRLAAHPKVLLTPHTAGLTEQSYKKLSQILAEKVIARFPIA